MLSFAKRYFFNLSNALNSKHNSHTIRILSPYRNISLFSFVFILNLSSSVGSPHHLVAQGVEEYVIRAFHYLYLIVCLSDGQSGTFPACLAPTIDGYQEVVTSAFYIEGNFPIVVDDNRADVEAMRSYRGDGDGLAMWNNHRSADA